MHRSLTATLVVLASVVSAGSSIQAREQDANPAIETECRYTGTQNPFGIVKPKDKNTLVFNHRDLTVTDKRLLVLEAANHGYFQVVFDCTAPEFFDYKISGDTEDNQDSAISTTHEESVPVPPNLLIAKGVTMQHDTRFRRYRVSAKLRPGVAMPSTKKATESVTAPDDLRLKLEKTLKGESRELFNQIQSVDRLLHLQLEAQRAKEGEKPPAELPDVVLQRRVRHLGCDGA